MIGIRYCWALFLFWVFPVFLGAQELEKSITVFNSDGTIAYGASILVDVDGFMWNATPEALIKKVGKRSIYFPYEHPEYDNLGKVLIKEALDSTIIGFSKFGCFTFDKQTGLFDWVYFYDDVFVPPIIDEEGNIWSITMKGDVSFCYTKKGEFLRFDHSHFLRNEHIKELNLRALYALDDGSLIAKSIHDKWFRISKDSMSLYKDLTSKTRRGKLSTFLVKNGTIFEKNASGTFTYREKEYPFYYLPEINRQLLYLPYDSSTGLEHIVHAHFSASRQNQTDLILISNDIIELIDVTQNKLEVKEAFRNKGVINNYTLQIEEDRLWISSSGILTAIPTENHVKKYRLEDLSGRKMTHYNARSIAKTSNGDLYFLQNASGIFRLKKNAKAFKEIAFTTKDGASNMRGLYGFFQQSDSILIGYGWRPEILKINIKNNTFSEIKLPTKDVNYAINDAQLLNENTLLLFGGSSILKVDLSNYSVTKLDALEAHFGPSQNIHTTYLDKKKQLLWLGMYKNDGLYRIDLRTNKVLHFHTESKDMPLIDNNINVIYADHQDILWLGTQKGLQELDTQNFASLRTFSNKEGLKNDHIVSITGNEKNIWFGTLNGLVVLDKKEGTFKTFSQDENFPDFEYNRKSILKVNNDSLFFGGMKGFIKINPKEPLFLQKRNQIFLTQINYYDNELGKDITSHFNLDTLNVINIPYRENYLYLNFGINQIFDHDKVNYRYKIIGINDQWIDLGNSGELFLQGIKSGDYKLQIQGFNASNEPSNILEYELCIDQPFYMKFWFYALCALFLISGFTTYIFYQQNEFSKAQTIHELEAKSSQAQMLPHFTFNTINCIQSVMLTKGEKEANKVIVAYSRLLRHTLDVFHSDLISLKDEISYLEAYLSVEQLRAHFTFSVTTDSKIDTRHWLIPSMMFQPLIENAIKHGIIPKKEEGALSVNFRITDEILVGEVIDNGIGRQASQQSKKQQTETYTSRATKILEERIYLFNKVYSKKIHFEIQDLKNEENPAGTKAILKIPLLTR